MPWEAILQVGLLHVIQLAKAECAATKRTRKHMCWSMQQASSCNCCLVTTVSTGGIVVLHAAKQPDQASSKPAVKRNDCKQSRSSLRKSSISSATFSLRSSKVIWTLASLTAYLHPQIPSLSEVALPLLEQTPPMPGGCMLIVGNQGSVK